MAKKDDLPDLSKAEYDILRVLWKKGKQTVREVHDQLQGVYGWAYTTTKTMMDRMTTKGLLSREMVHGIYLYRPLITRPVGLVRLVQFFADRVLEIDASSIITMFTQSNAITLEESQELERLLKEQQDQEE
jgi:predicted transcriptional regulator